MSLLSYQEVRPWAKAIKSAVLSRKMPPSFVDPAYGHFKDDRRLSDADIKTLVAWADGNAAEGDAKDKPEPVKFVEGWGFEPDMIIEMPMDVPLQATGTINYQNILVKVNFPEDRWVIAADLRPSNRQVVHHMRANVRPPGSTFMKNAVPGIAYDTADPAMRATRGAGSAIRTSICTNRRSSCRRDRTSSSICTTPRSAKKRPIALGLR
jgi:hypothetical protein